MSELVVITKAKDLCSYILIVTEKSPKRFRWTLVSRMQNLALDIIEKIYGANEVFGEYNKRLNLQHEALTATKLLGYIAMLSFEQGAILQKQFEQITKKVSDVQNLLGAWIKSDRTRFCS
ncbi:MAG: four helix bundle protein [Oscillospiraceae bacterium]|nr:four helix bundle protein [Oscillospiraceae bacterium]